MRHLCEWCHSIMGQHPCTLIKIVKTLSVMLVTTALLITAQEQSTGRKSCGV